MHHLDLGLFKYMIEFTRQILLIYGGQAAIDNMDFRYNKIPKYSKLRHFPTGLHNFNRITAADYRALMKITVFVLEDLFPSTKKKLESEILQLFVNWNKMYLWSRENRFSENDLITFEV